jgi:hypothetical protein
MVHRLAKLAWLTPLAALAGCAHVSESTTREILAREPVRLSELPQATLDRLDVVHSLSGQMLVLRVTRHERCVVDMAERQRVREHVVREPRQSSIAGEAVLFGAATATAIAAFGSEDDGNSGALRRPDVVGATAVAVALASGVALAVDASRYTNEIHERVVVVAKKKKRVADCEKQGPSPRRVELVTRGGRRFSAGLDGLGRTELRLPEDIWPEDGRLDLDLFVDGTLQRRLIVTRQR